MPTWTGSDWDTAQAQSNVVVEGGSISLDTAIPDSGVARWQFEQDLTDSWGSYTLTNNGGSYTTDSYQETYALYLNGGDTADRNGIPLSGEMTVTAWVKNSASSRQYIMGTNPSNSDQFWIGVNEDGTYFSRGDFSNSIGSTGAQVYGQGYILVGTVFESSGTVRDYVGGNEVYSYSRGSTPDLSAAIFQIGNRGEGYAGRYWDGLVDDTRLYDKALTSSEFSNLASTGSISG